MKTGNVVSAGPWKSCMGGREGGREELLPAGNMPYGRSGVGMNWEENWKGR